MKKDYKDSEINKLRKIIRRKDMEISRLKGELKTLNNAFTEIGRFLRHNTNDISVEDMIHAANKEQSLKEIREEVKPVCKRCLNNEVHIGEVPFGKLITCKNKHCKHVEIIRNESIKK